MFHDAKALASTDALTLLHGLMADNDTNQKRPSDVVTRIQNALRLAAAAGAGTRYTCPICSEPSNSGPELWEHAKQAHPDSPEVTVSIEGVDAKERFLGKKYVKFLRDKASSEDFLYLSSQDVAMFFQSPIC